MLTRSKTWPVSAQIDILSRPIQNAVRDAVYVRGRAVQSGKKNQGPSQRQLKAGEMVRKALANIFLTADLRDPDLAGVTLTVTEVSMSPDLKNAKAYVSPLNMDDGEDVVEGLRRHRKFLRGELARRVQMKYTPDIEFALDLSYRHSSRIDEILRSPKVAQDLGESK
ncbi:MAG: 30S ribosome-binding factor RbfA [Methyloligellaceae bacterium]